MKHTLSSKDFKWIEIEEWMRFTMWDKEKIKSDEWLIIKEGDIKIVWWKFIFKNWDVIVIKKTQQVKKAWNDKLRNEVTFQVERWWKAIEKDWTPIDYTFMGTLLIHHLFSKWVSNLAEVLIDAREKNKWKVKDLLDEKN